MDHQGAPSEAERSQAIVGAGVTGSGKSTTLDVLSDRAGTFAHLQSAESATASFQEYTVPETKRTLVDAPGQSDPDQTLEDRNHAQIKAALARSEVQSWLFVISPDGSRITAGDEEVCVHAAAAALSLLTVLQRATWRIRHTAGSLRALGPASRASWAL